MAKKKFIPKHDLDQLSEAEQLEYVELACEHLGVPSDLGLVSLGFMDSGDGKRKKVLYVHKGATDIVRDHRGINVESMIPLAANKEYVGFTATGKDSKGRQEVAVGAVSISGLTGVAVANAVMTAQTKASRRLTLIYAGGGFFDETEVSEITRNIANSASSLSTVAAQPSTAPSAAPGKDITESAPTSESASEEPKERKKRGKKSVSLDTPISEAQPAEAVPQNNGLSEQKPVEPITVAPAVAEKQASVTLPEQPKLEPIINGTAPTTEQKDEFGARLKNNYIYNKEFMDAGFLQSAARGSKSDQMKAFAKKMFPKASFQTMSVEQWAHLFNYLDSKLKEIGAAELVKLIYAQIDKEDADA